ncbi:cadmium-translocating P-type ATPase [Pontibacter diazotrophicus]|uniref:P-type Zn(2+) transporter n=1 Tax=Pontibacter diazotrophicus TaxID=1400979 RepID=A0A3D8LBZ0_9BACT|nr:heavy metal translocating P-type ATPase [Pontibacter diazotrophicus]RDV14928.1 cadmium-translocating P-type ATPase [Pontibacter diazotrophicus]
MKNNKADIETEFKPLEITSPRTAEAPGPDMDSCCSGGACAASSGQVKEAQEEAKESYLPTIVSFVLLVTGIALDYFDVAWFTGLIRFLTFGVAYVLVGWRVVWHAIRSARSSFFNEFLLMTVATLGAFYLGEYAEGVAVMLFYVVGEHFQEAAVIRSRRSIRDLIDNRPDMVNLQTASGVTSVPAKEVRVGETMLVRPGEKVALDGQLQSDAAAFNTAALTGEAKPDTKRQGDKVLAGMINLNTAATLQVTAAYEDSALSKILQLIEQASGRKAKTQKFITRFAKVYTPIVFFLALGITLLPYFFVDTYVFGDWFYRALVFLVISCPCALVVSIPLGYFGGIGAASRNGILFKGANFLDQVTQLDTVVMDKTGTLTEGVFEVQKVSTLCPDEQEFLSYVTAVESLSTHPVAQAVTAYAGKPEVQATQVQEVPGHGVKGLVNGREVLAGNGKLLRQFGVTYDTSIDAIPDTTVLVAIDGSYAGHLVIADKIKADATAAVKALRSLGIKRLVMLSGDKDSIVQKVAKELQLDEAYGGLLPQDKVAKVEELKAQQKKVAFVGDGINDAPVITLSDVGIAMGGLGSDAAIETADVVIQTDQPSKIATAISVGKKTKQVVWQNIGMAFGVKAAVLLLGAVGVASMWEAVFADVGVALLAILNAVRIQRMKF